MVIGFDGSRAFIDNRTGTENYSFQLLKALTKIDKTNQYLIYVRPLTKYPEAASDYINLVKNFKLMEINWPKLWTQGGLALETFKEKQDVLFVPAHTLPLIRKGGLKTVLTVHDLGSEYLPNMHRIKQRLYLSFMQRYQLKTASKVIAVSKATRKDLIERIGIKPEKVAVIYEGFDRDLFKPVKGQALANSLARYNLQPCLPAGRPNTYYLFVGTLQPRKNLARIIHSFAKLVCREKGFKKRTLVIAGSKGWFSDDIYRLPEKLGIEDKVKFLGYVADKDLKVLYSGAIALVFPSLFEGFGLPILEAQACGCPVITSNISSMPEVSGKGAILVDPYSTEDIIRGMRRIDSIRAKLIKLGFENLNRFSWEKCARETLAVLEGISKS